MANGWRFPDTDEFREKWATMNAGERFLEKAKLSGVWRVKVSDDPTLFRTNEPGDPLPDGVHEYGLPGPEQAEAA